MRLFVPVFALALCTACGADAPTPSPAAPPSQGGNAAPAPVADAAGGPQNNAEVGFGTGEAPSLDEIGANKFELAPGTGVKVSGSLQYAGSKKGAILLQVVTLKASRPHTGDSGAQTGVAGKSSDIGARLHTLYVFEVRTCILPLPVTAPGEDDVEHGCEPGERHPRKNGETAIPDDLRRHPLHDFLGPVLEDLEIGMTVHVDEPRRDNQAGTIDDLHFG